MIFWGNKGMKRNPQKTKLLKRDLERELRKRKLKDHRWIVTLLNMRFDRASFNKWLSQYGRKLGYGKEDIAKEEETILSFFIDFKEILIKLISGNLHTIDNEKGIVFEIGKYKIERIPDIKKYGWRNYSKVTTDYYLTGGPAVRTDFRGRKETFGYKMINDQMSSFRDFLSIGTIEETIYRCRWCEKYFLRLDKREKYCSRKCKKDKDMQYSRENINRIRDSKKRILKKRMREYWREKEDSGTKFSDWERRYRRSKSIKFFRWYEKTYPLEYKDLQKYRLVPNISE